MTIDMYQKPCGQDISTEAAGGLRMDVLAIEWIRRVAPRIKRGVVEVASCSNTDGGGDEGGMTAKGVARRRSLGWLPGWSRPRSGENQGID